MSMLYSPSERRGYTYEDLHFGFLTQEDVTPLSKSPEAIKLIDVDASNVDPAEVLPYPGYIELAQDEINGLVTDIALVSLNHFYSALSHTLIAMPSHGQFVLGDLDKLLTFTAQQKREVMLGGELHTFTLLEVCNNDLDLVRRIIFEGLIQNVQNRFSSQPQALQELLTQYHTARPKLGMTSTIDQVREVLPLLNSHPLFVPYLVGPGISSLGERVASRLVDGTQTIATNTFLSDKYVFAHPHFHKLMKGNNFAAYLPEPAQTDNQRVYFGDYQVATNFFKREPYAFPSLVFYHSSLKTRLTIIQSTHQVYGGKV